MSNLTIDKKYFRDKTKNEVLPEHLDSQFNLIATYINETLIPFIESVIFTVTNGVAGQPDALFCNINNDEVGYMYINDINVDDNLLALNKITKIAAGSVLASNYEGDIVAVAPTDNDQLLFGNPIDGLSFRRITSDDIDNNVLTGKQLGVLSAENFAADAFVDIIKDDSIYENMLRDVSNEKIAAGEIDFKHIGEFIVGIFDNLPYTQGIAAQVLLKDFDDNSITKEKITDYTIAPANFIDPQFIEGKNIFPGSIMDNHLKTYNANTQPPAIINLANLINSNFGAIINFPAQGINVHNVKLSREKIALNSLSLNNFSQEIQNAINKYKEIKDRQAAPPPQPMKTKPDGTIYLGSFRLNPPIAVPNTTEGLKYVFITVAPRVISGQKQQYWDWYVLGFMTNNWIYMSRGDFIIIPLRLINPGLGQYEHSHIYVGNVPGLEAALKPYPRYTQGSPEFWSWKN